MKTALILAVAALSAAAQTPGEPPPILKLIQTPGADSASVRPYAEARAALNVIGMTSITGTPETWLMEAHYAYAGIEDLDRAMAAAPPANPLLPPHTLLALYRPAWSYRPDQAVKALSVARYCYVTVYRVRPGTEPDFGELVKLRRWNFDAMNLDRPDMAYQVTSGAPSGTYVFLAPLVSLRTLDDNMSRMAPVHAEAAMDAGIQRALKIAQASELSREHFLFRVEPRMSYVSDEFAAADPDYWRPKAR